MAGLGDLLMGGVETYPVPQPQVSMADLLAGQTLAPPPQGGNVVSTAYGDSPAPGAVAQAAAQANGAAAQEPGVMDRVRSWVQTNPTAAQGLMQGFAALASGRTHGNAIMQLGQAAGTATQAMGEQGAANEAQQRAIQAEQQRQQLAQQQEGRLGRTADSNIALNQNQDRRAEASNKENILASRSNRKAKDQATEQAGMMFTPRMEAARAELDKIRADIAATKDVSRKRALEIEGAQFELKLRKQFGSQEAELILGKRAAEQSGAEERATQEVLKTDQATWERDNRNMLSEPDRLRLARGEKLAPTKTPMSASEYAKQLLQKNPEAYMNANGPGYDTIRLMKDAQELMKIDSFSPEELNRQLWMDARSKVKPGERYLGPDGGYHTRGKD